MALHQIRNRRTGEVRIVNDTDLPSYGLGGATGMDMVGGGTGNGGDPIEAMKMMLVMKGIQDPKNASKYMTQIQLLKEINPADKLTAEQQNKKMSKADGERVLRVLEDQYFFGDRGPLAYATNGIGGKAEGLKEQLQAMYSSDYNPELNAYLSLLDTTRATFAKAAGDVGNMSQSEQQNAIKSIPKGTNTYTEAKLYFNNMRKRMGLKERDFDTELGEKGINQTVKGNGEIIPVVYRGKSATGQPTATPKTAAKKQPDSFTYNGETIKFAPSLLNPPTATPPPQSGASPTQTPPTGEKSQKYGFLHSKWPEVIGGTLGFLGGTVAGGGVGSPITAPTGALAGVGAAKAIKNSLLELLGEQSEATQAKTPDQKFGMLLNDPMTAYSVAQLLGPYAMSTIKKPLLNKAPVSTMDSKPLLSGAKQLAKDMPYVRNQYSQVASSLPKQLSAQDIDRLLTNWGKVTFTKGGDAKTNALALIYGKMYGPARHALAELSPSVSMARSGVDRMIALKKLLDTTGGIIGRSAVGVGAGLGAGYGIAKMTGQQ